MTKRDFPPIHPGGILLTEFLEPMGVTQCRLAKDIGVTPRRINAIVQGRRAITADTALRLGRFFTMEAEFWLNLQNIMTWKWRWRLWKIARIKKCTHFPAPLKTVHCRTISLRWRSDPTI